MPLIKLYYFSYYYYCSKGLHAPLWASLTAKQTWNCTFIAVIMRRALVLAMYLSDPSPTITALPVLFPATFYIITIILINISGMARCENVHHNYSRGFSLKKTRNAKRRSPRDDASWRQERAEYGTSCQVLLSRINGDFRQLISTPAGREQTFYMTLCID